MPPATINSPAIRAAVERHAQDPQAAVREFRASQYEYAPPFLLHRHDANPSGAVPTILNGYGGFNISRTPAYSAAAAAWVISYAVFFLYCRGRVHLYDRYQQS